MNASLSGLLVLLLLSGSWALGRRRSRPFLRSTDAGTVAALNRAQIERLQEAPPSTPEPASGLGASAGSRPEQPVPAQSSGGSRAVHPATTTSCPSLSKVRLLVDCWGSRSREERLSLLDLARRQPQPVLLPLLRRALRDPDPQLVAAAASALERYRGVPRPSVTAASPVRPVTAGRSSSRPSAFRG